MEKKQEAHISLASRWGWVLVLIKGTAGSSGFTAGKGHFRPESKVCHPIG